MPIFFSACVSERSETFANLSGHDGRKKKEELLIAKAPFVDKVRVNDKIRASQIRVISDDGEQLGIMTPEDAMREAEKLGLDLVEVAPKATPSVCRIMDYGKYRYQQSKRVKESRKHQHTVTVKEIKYRPKIDIHDYEYKTNHVRQFLEEGNKVKITIMFRGREMTHPEFGRDIIARVVEETQELCQPLTNFNPRLEGRTMSVILTSAKRQPAKK